MSLNSIEPRPAFATAESADLNVFLEFEDFDGERYFRVVMDSDMPSVKDAHIVRDLLTAFIDSQAPKLTLVPTDPSDPVCVSREIVAGVEVTEYLSPEDGPTVALETDEVVHVEHLPELIKFLKSIHEDHRLSEARSYFASEDAIDPSKHTVQSLARFAEDHGFDVPAFMTVAAEVMSR